MTLWPSRRKSDRVIPAELNCRDCGMHAEGPEDAMLALAEAHACQRPPATRLRVWTTSQYDPQEYADACASVVLLGAGRGWLVVRRETSCLAGFRLEDVRRWESETVEVPS